MKNRLLENVVDRMIAVYEVEHSGQKKYSVGYFAVDPEDLLDFVRTDNAQEEQTLHQRVQAFKKAFDGVDFADQTKMPQLCPMVEKATNDISDLDSVTEAPVIYLGYCVHQQEATVGMQSMMRTFLINYRAMAKKGLTNPKNDIGEFVYQGPKVDRFISEGNRGALAKAIRGRYDQLYGFHMTNQAEYKDQAAAAIRGFFAGTPLLSLAEEMISVVESMDPSRNGENRPLERLGEQYVGLLTATAFEDYKGAADYKRSIEEMKETASE